MGSNGNDISAHTCSRHPAVVTRLSCGRCGDPICPDCMVYASVGLRCGDCAGQAKPPIYDVGLTHLVIAVALGIVFSLIGTSLWILIPGFLSRFGLGFYGFIAMISVGHFTAHFMSLALKRKKGRELQVIAGSTVVLGYILAIPFAPSLFNSYAIFSLIVSVLVAVARLR